MTSSEKAKAIIQRAPALGGEYPEESISMMVITGYLNQLSNYGLCVPSHEVTKLGKNVIAICEEFDWKPTDEHIQMFLDDMVSEEHRPAYRHFITQFRDNREELLKKLKEFDKKRKSGEL